MQIVKYSFKYSLSMKLQALIALIALALILSGCIQNENASNNPKSNTIPSNTPLQTPSPTQTTATQTPQPTTSPKETITATPQKKPQASVSISTDKNQYGSNEKATITVTASVSESLKNAKIKIWGIKPYSKNYIESEKVVDLSEGQNTIEFVETTPYCTAGCGGVFPGPYDLFTSVEFNGLELAKAKTEITLVSH
ncbi:MAG: hypothetical protein QXK06_04720 [Candidatus Diapherotrites archaeon]